MTGFVHQVLSQVSSAFLKDAIYQNNEVNPAYFPEARLVVGLPVISGSSVSFNSRFAYNDVFNNLDNGVNEISLDKFLGSLKDNNYLGANVRINDLYIGYRRNQAAISFFINDRVDFDFFFPKALIDFAVNGNAGFIGETIDLSKLGVNASHYREFGFGYTYFDKKDRFSVGYRAKLLSGFYHASTLNSFEGTLATNEDNFALTANLKNAQLRVVTVPDGGNFVFSSNLGASVDLGFDYRYNDAFSIAFSLSDIGFISWKDDVDIEQVEDSEFTYEGVDIRNTDNLVDALEDSLQDKFNLIEDIDEPFTTLLPIRGNLTGTWHLTDNSEVAVAIMPRYVRGFLQMHYGAGITQKLGRNLRLSVSANKLPQQQFNMGASLAAHLGPLQIYGGTDKVLGYDLTEVRNFNYTFGINLAFGRGKVKKTKEYYPSKFRINGGEELTVRGKEKIYLIIKKQKPRKPVGAKGPTSSRPEVIPNNPRQPSDGSNN